MGFDRSKLNFTDDATHNALATQQGHLHGYVAAPLNIKGMVCIGCWGRSGSALMSSMVDNHPELVQIYPQHGLLSVYFEVLPTIAHTASIDTIVNAVVACFAQVPGHPVAWTSLSEDEAGTFSELLAFHLQSLQRDGTMNRRNVFLAIHAAYSHAKNLLPETDTPLIVFQSHANDFRLRTQIRKDFPEARFVVMVRFPPRARDSALKAFTEVLPEQLPDAKDQFFHMHPFSISALNLTFMTEMGRQTSRVEDIVAIRFEDLHMRTRETMQWLANWLGIAWNECLLESTMWGKAGWGKQSVYGDRHVNVGTRMLTRQDYYTACQSTIDLLKYRAYQDEFYLAWNYHAPRLSPAMRYLALNILCFWPTRVHWRALRKLLRHAGWRSYSVIIADFMKRHIDLALEFRAEYSRQRQMLSATPVVNKAPACDDVWPDAENRVA